MFAALPLSLSLLLAPTIVVSLTINPAQILPVQHPQLQLPNASLPTLPI